MSQSPVLFNTSIVPQSTLANPHLACHKCSRFRSNTSGICIRRTEQNTDCEILFVYYEPDESTFKSGQWSFMHESLCVTIAKNTLKHTQIALTGSRQCPNKSGRLVTVDNACDSHALCSSWLDNEIRSFNPSVIVPIGFKATGAVLHCAFPQYVGKGVSGGNYIGFQIPCGKYNAWICPVFSSRDNEDVGLLQQTHRGEMPTPAQPFVYLYINQHMERVLELVDKRPFSHAGFDPTPSLGDFEIVMSPNALSEIFDKWCSEAEYAAFDYECNCLNPESVGARVLTASVAFGDENGNILKTIAFSFTDKNYDDVWRKFLRSDIRKIGGNIKFEERWGLVYFNQPTNNWYWDVCVAGHIQDATPGNAGVKHLCFVHFGVGGYDKDVEPFLKTRHLYGLNELEKKLKRDALLTYNAIDSIMTLKLMYKQKEELEIADNWDRMALWRFGSKPKSKKKVPVNAPVEPLDKMSFYCAVADLSDDW